MRESWQTVLALGVTFPLGPDELRDWSTSRGTWLQEAAAARITAAGGHAEAASLDVRDAARVRALIGR